VPYPRTETAREHVKNAATLCSLAIQEGRALSFEETVAVRNRLEAATEWLDEYVQLKEVTR
jgi:hypothetical protein